MAELSQIFEFNGTGLDISAIVICLVAGIAIAVITAFFINFFSGRIIRGFSKYRAYEESEAMTLTEIGLGNRFLYGFLLRNRGPLRRYLKLANEQDAVINGKLKLSAAKFYLLKEKESKALAIYGEKETTPLQLILIIAALILTAVAAVIVIPLVNELVSELFN